MFNNIVVQDISSSSVSMATIGRRAPSPACEGDETTLTGRAIDEGRTVEPLPTGSEEGGAWGESGGGEGVEGGCGDGDRYLYLQRGFTSEIFKIEIQNIPKYIGYTVRYWVFLTFCMSMCIRCMKECICMCLCVCGCV